MGCWEGPCWASMGPTENPTDSKTGSERLLRPVTTTDWATEHPSSTSKSMGSREGTVNEGT
jgi:hypothetical protein